MCSTYTYNQCPHRRLWWQRRTAEKSPQNYHIWSETNTNLRVQKTTAFKYLGLCFIFAPNVTVQCLGLSAVRTCHFHHILQCWHCFRYRYCTAQSCRDRRSKHMRSPPTHIYSHVNNRGGVPADILLTWRSLCDWQLVSAPHRWMGWKCQVRTAENPNTQYRHIWREKFAEENPQHCHRRTEN